MEQLGTFSYGVIVESVRNRFFFFGMTRIATLTALESKANYVHIHVREGETYPALESKANYVHINVREGETYTVGIITR